MALVFRQIHTKIWDDTNFQDYSPEEKLLFIYLFSNSRCRQSGIYPISYQTIANETGIPKDHVVTMLIESRIKNVIYDPVSGYVIVRHFKRHNPGGAKDLIDKSIIADYNDSSHVSLWDGFFFDNPELKAKCNSNVNSNSKANVNSNGNGKL